MKALANKQKLIPTEAIRELTSGSYEHLTYRLDGVIEENAQFFSKDQEVARIATFADRVILGTEDGKYFSVKFEDKNGQITLGEAQTVELPVVDEANIDKYVNSFAMKVVDSMLSGNKDGLKEGLLALANLSESVDEEFDQSLDELVRQIVHSQSEWKVAYAQQRENIRRLVSDLVESIEAAEIQAKYVPLYDGTIPEEKFHLYMDVAQKDLGVVQSRLAALESKTEKAYLPFVEAIRTAELTPDDKKAVNQFIDFSEGFTGEIHDLREHVAMALGHEKCVMCLGQIHDTIAESLVDYELAGSFIERMASRFLDSE